MGLKIDEIIAVILVCLFYIVLLGRYSIRLVKKWCNRKKETANTDIEAQNGATETDESALLSDPQSSSSELKPTPKLNEVITRESSSLSDPQSSSSSLEQMPKPSEHVTKELSSLSDPQSSLSVFVQKPKPCVTTA